MSSLLFRFKKSLINAPVAASFAILRGFVLRDEGGFRVDRIEAIDIELRLIGVYGEIILWSYSYVLANNSFSVLESSSILNGFCKNPSKSHPKPSPF